MTAPAAFPPPGFRRFWCGEAVSSLGTYVTLFALPTLVVLTLGTAGPGSPYWPWPPTSGSPRLPSWVRCSPRSPSARWG